MKKSLYLGAAGALFALITAGQTLGHTGPALYETFWWFDLLMHFMGGLLISVVFGWFCIARNKKLSKETLLLVWITAFVIGVAWEIGQYVIYQADMYPLVDTVSDVIMDMLGAGTGIIILAMHQRLRNLKPLV